MANPLIDLDGMEGVSLIDVASEEDLLVSPSIGRFPSGSQTLDYLAENCAACPTKAVNHFQNEAPNNCNMQTESVLLQSDSPEPKVRASGKLNLRKSLAWDSAFFTSEGVLDPDELAIVSSTFKKAEPQSLPAIQEDPRKSFESCTTFDSDNLTVESLEADLFEDLRASINKSYDKFDDPSTTEHSSNNAGSTKLTGPKRIDSTSKNVKKPPVASRTINATKQRSEITQKDISHTETVVNANGGQKSSSRPPQVTSRANVSKNKIYIPQTVQVKKNAGRPLSGATTPSKTANPGDPRAVASKSSSKVSSNGSASTKIASLAPRSSYRSGSSLSTQTSNTSLDTSRKKVDSNNFKKSSNSGVNSPSISLNKDASRIDNNQKSFLKYASKFSPSASPSSSFESVASGSSSSSASTIRKPESIETIGISSSSNLVSENCASLTGSTYARSHANSTSGSKLSKPSGLRMPSPKIGYFDADKSLPGNSTKCSDRVLQGALPACTSGIVNLAGVPKSIKVQSKSITAQSSECLNSVSNCAPRIATDDGRISNIPKPTNSRTAVSGLAGSCQFPKLDARSSNQSQHHLASAASSKSESTDPAPVEENSDFDKTSIQKASLDGDKVFNYQQSAVSDTVQCHLENKVSVAKNNEKENLLPAGDEFCGLAQKTEAADKMKSTELENSLCSSKVSLPDVGTLGNAGNFNILV